MEFKEPGYPQKNKESENPPKEEKMDIFEEKLNSIKEQISLINVWPGDRIDKDSKSNAVKVIEQLATEPDLEKRKELVSDLRSLIGLIDVWKGTEQDKKAKIRAQELIEELR